MKAKQQLKKEHKLDEKVLMEHLEWEQAQLAIADQDRQEYLLWKRGQMREAHLGAMELERRRNTVTAMSKSFFDKLTILSAPQAMEVGYLLDVGRLSGMEIGSDHCFGAAGVSREARTAPGVLHAPISRSRGPERAREHTGRLQFLDHRLTAKCATHIHHFRERDNVNGAAMQSEVEEMIEKAHGDLKYRMRSHQREEVRGSGSCSS